MKFLGTLLILLFTISAQAIITKTCPNGLSISLRDFQAIKSLKESDYKYLERPEEVIASYQSLKTMDDLELNVKIDTIENSNCYYSDDTLDDSFYLRVIITGSLKKNAKKPAGLSIFWSYEAKNQSVNYSTFIPLTDVQVESVTMKYPEGYAAISHLTKYCERGECGPASVRLGKAGFLFIQAL